MLVITITDVGLLILILEVDLQ